ncbi:MAG: DUF3618 domain-containing protein [Gemmatimonas sp.]|nr:DUF3618 domain-containing protein [Gemmatimonas sp.]
MHDRIRDSAGSREREEAPHTAVESEDPESIRAEIERTRARMSHTVDELSERLKPRRVKDDLKRNLHDVTMGKAEHMARAARQRVDDTGHNLMDSIRDNPIPAAMAGIGLGWLFLNSQRDHNDHVEARQTAGRTNPGYYGTIPPRPAESREEERELESGYDYAAGDGAQPEEEGASRMGEVRDRARARGEGLADRVQDRASQISHEAHEMFDDLGTRADQIASDARARADRLDDRLEDSPLALGAAALAVGLAVGLGAPATRREATLMGGARDRLIDLAREAAHDAVDRAKHVAERVADEAEATAREAIHEEPYA